jgi:hypothetical protein
MVVIIFIFRSVFILFICFTTVRSFAQKKVTIWRAEREFCMGNGNNVEHIWGELPSFQGTYFDELLPAFFARKLLFENVALSNSKFKWILTGAQGGITITITSDSVEVIQRYYNSFAFNTLKNDDFISKRFPEFEFTKTAIQIKKLILKSVVLDVNHALGLSLLINDSLVMNQLTQLDVSKHQIQVEGLQAVACGKMEAPASEVVELKLFSKNKFQKILGFGGITSPVAYNMLSKNGKEKWWKYIKEYNLLIQREYPLGRKLKPNYSNWDGLSDATPHYYGDNFPNGEVSDFSYNKRIQENGGLTVFEFWQLPDWMMNKSAREGDRIVSTIDYDKYAEAIVKYCSTAKQKTGKPPAIVGIQNEVTQPDDIWRAMTMYLRNALDRSGFAGVKIHMHNAVTLNRGSKALMAFSKEDTVWRNIDYAASNLYDYQSYFTNTKGFDSVLAKWNNVATQKEVRPFLSVEMCVNDARYQSGSYKIAFIMGELYHKNLVHLNAVSLMYCWLLVNTVQPSFAASRSLFTIDESKNNIPVASSYQMRVFGAFSRHLFNGTQRMEITSSDAELLASAYSKEKKLTVILLNKGTVAKKLNLDSFTGMFSGIEVVSPYRENEKMPIPANKQLLVEPGSIVTLF